VPGRINSTAPLLAFVLLLAACSKISTSVAPPGSGHNPWSTRGLLRVASRQEPDNLNTMFGTEVIDKDLSMFWAGYLFNWSNDNELVPELATTVPTLRNGGISRDGLTLTYHLRRGVKWQDGAPFGADDVIYTWQQMLNPDNPVVSRVGYDVIKRIDKPDDHTLVIHLKQRFAPFVNSFFTMSNNPVAVLPKHLLGGLPNLAHASYNRLPIGTGPFRIVDYERGSHLTFVRNPLYWRGLPRLQKIEWHIVGNDNTMLILLKSHEIDFYYRATEAQLPVLREIAGTRVLLTEFTQFADVGINAAHPPLDDVRVRRALAYATNRQELIDKVSHGVNALGDTDQPSFFWAHDDRAPTYPYDPKRAGLLLDQAGWRMGADGLRHKDGKPLVLDMVGFTGSSTVAGAQQVIQEQWHQAGIGVQIKNFPSNQLYATLANNGIEQTGNFDVSYEEWANGVDPDESILVRCDMAPPKGWNIYHFCSRALDRAEADALVNYDQAKRKADYAVAQREIAGQLPFIIIWYVRRLDVINTDFAGYKPAHAVTPFWNTWEWYVWKPAVP
jgi:peptide/nickel transport system substrate-binding protein